MGRLVREAMEQGAVGLSSGLDYIPSRYADTAELTALCREIAPFGGVYVTHMRGYDPDGVHSARWTRSSASAGTPAWRLHISHFNSRADLVLPQLDQARAGGLDVTFDLYCYLAGSTILGMVALPPWVQEGGIDATLARLRDPAVRTRLRSDWFAGPRGPLEDGPPQLRRRAGLPRLRGPDARRGGRRRVARPAPRPSAISSATCWSRRSWRSAAWCRTGSAPRRT